MDHVEGRRQTTVRERDKEEKVEVQRKSPIYIYLQTQSFSGNYILREKCLKKFSSC